MKVVLWMLFFALLIWATLGLKNSINQEEIKTQSTIDSLQNVIDSLYHEIDTLQWENQIWDFNLSQNATHLLSAIMFVESSYDDLAYNPNEDAVGCLQIRKCMVNDVNRILRRQKSDLRFTYDDRWLRNKSIKMFSVYCKHYKLTTSEEIARCWNGGPRGMQNEVTAKYWVKVKNQLDS
tara:strand:- start:252 stop:788 length:537 start_codon:yes stop_codon:yes gene_type:complete